MGGVLQDAYVLQRHQANITALVTLKAISRPTDILAFIPENSKKNTVLFMAYRPIFFLAYVWHIGTHLTGPLYSLRGKK